VLKGAAMKAVIIGGVAAGMSAASKIKRNDPTAEVTVYEKGNYLSYGACGLPYFVSGENTDYTKMIARTREEFSKAGINTYLKHEVLSVSPEQKTVTVSNLENGEVFKDSYDSLLIATGCTSVGFCKKWQAIRPYANAWWWEADILESK